MTKPETMLLIALCLLALLMGISEGQRNHEVREMSHAIDRIEQTLARQTEAISKAFDDIGRIYWTTEELRDELTYLVGEISHIETMIRFPNG